MSVLKLYYLFQETSTLSNDASILCKATLMTYGSYDASSATTWCAANIATFAATSFYDGKTLISYTATTPMSSSVAGTVLTQANRRLLNSTLWDNGFFSRETSLAAVIDVENGDLNRVAYSVIIGLYGALLMGLTVVMYMTLKRKKCGNPCSNDYEKYDNGDDTTSDEEEDSDKEQVTVEEEEGHPLECCCAYKATILHALYLTLNMSLIITYGVIVFNDNDYIESKTMIGLTEHIPFMGLPFFSVFLF